MLTDIIMFTTSKQLKTTMSDFKCIIEYEKMKSVIYSYKIILRLSNINKEPLYSWLKTVNEIVKKHSCYDLSMFINVIADRRNKLSCKLYNICSTESELSFQFYIPAQRHDYDYDYRYNDVRMINELVAKENTSCVVKLLDLNKHLNCMEIYLSNVY